MASEARQSLIRRFEIASSLRSSRETNGSGGIAKGFALDDGFAAYGDSIVKAGGLGDATRNRGLGFFLTPAASVQRLALT